jgi:thioredoxin 1
MKEYAGQLDVVEVCTDDLPDIASNAGVVSIPTIQLYYQGEVMDTIIGCVARNVLSSSVSKVLEDNLGPEPDGGDDES